MDSAAQCYNLHDPLVHYNMPLSLQEMEKVVSKIGKVGKSLQLANYRQGKNWILNQPIQMVVSDMTEYLLKEGKELSSPGIFLSF